MNTPLNIKRTEQKLNHLQSQLAREKLRERKKATRRKIEFGGLVIKGGLANYSKAVILGAIIDAVAQLTRDPKQESLFTVKGERAFMGFGKY